ncbi:hypothetical protein [Thermococcus sp.]
MPKQKQVQNKVEDEKVEAENEIMDVKSSIPTIDDILGPSLFSPPTIEEEAEESARAEDVTKTTMSYLMRKDKERAKLIHETIRILPEIAKSDNPLAAVMVEKLLDSGKSASSDIEELKDLAKAMTYTVVLPEMMKDVLKSVRGGGSDVDQTTLVLLKALEERDRRLQELIKEIKENKESKLIDEMRKEMYETMNAIVESFSKSLQEIQNQIISISQMQQPQTSNDPFEAFERLIEYEEKAKQLLEKRGYKVVDYSELIQRIENNAEADLEKTLKLKELEIKKKEIEARNQLYNRIGEAISKLAEDPNNIIQLVRGIVSIFRGGPSNEQLIAAMNEASASNVVANIPSKSSIPSLESFIGGSNG